MALTQHKILTYCTFRIKSIFIINVTYKLIVSIQKLRTYFITTDFFES